MKSCVLCDEPAEHDDRFCAACGAPIVEVTRATKSNELIEPATVPVTVEPELATDSQLTCPAPVSASTVGSDDARRKLDDAIIEYSEGPISASTLPRVEANLATRIKLSQATRLVTGKAPMPGSDVVRETGAQHDESEVSIRSIVAAQVVAWDAGDVHAYARHLAADVSFTNMFGVVRYGAPAFAQRHTEILATFYRGTTKHHLVRCIRLVTPDVAIVDIDSEVHGVTAMPQGFTLAPDGIVRTQLMEVFVRRDDRWWIEAYHNVDLKPAAQQSRTPSGDVP